jgi:hypothetical protein
VRLHDGRYECTLCGAILDIPVDKEPSVVIKASSGAPNLRAIVYDGCEVHRCPVDPAQR